MLHDNANPDSLEEGDVCPICGMGEMVSSCDDCPGDCYQGVNKICQYDRELRNSPLHCDYCDYTEED